MKNTPTPASRDSHDHNTRGQIPGVAMAYFSHYDYEKTTVTDFAKAIGLSKAYIYKFSDSKQAIGKAICANRLEKIMVAVSATIAGTSSASEKLRRLFRILTEADSEPFFEDHKLYDIAAVVARDKWPLTEQYAGYLQQLVGQILVEGRQTGEFERKAPPDEVTLAAYMVICLSINSVQLQYNLDTAPITVVLLVSPILRSFSP